MYVTIIETLVISALLLVITICEFRMSKSQKKLEEKPDTEHHFIDTNVDMSMSGIGIIEPTNKRAPNNEEEEGERILRL